MKKLPRFYQWKQLPKVLNKKEKLNLFLLLTLFFTSSIFLIFNFYFKNTEIRPIQGGVYTEGLIGQPRFINPIYSPIGDIDQDLVKLIFSGLMKYEEEGKLIPDLAKDYKIKENGSIYEFYLREDIFWHDGNQFSADDVIFTIRTIQNPDFKSPLMPIWAGVKVEKINEFKIRFTLPRPYAPFLENTTIGILPKHLWENISHFDFPLSRLNLQPIGTGPFKWNETVKDEQSGFIQSLKLKANLRYHNKRPYLSKIIFYFYPNKQELLRAAQQGKIKGFASSPPLLEYNYLKENFNIFSFHFLRYFAVFFNLEKSEILKQKNIRQALNYGTNKQEIVEQILKNKGEIIHSPILSEILNLPNPIRIYEFNLEKARNLLEKANFYDKDQDGFRERIVQKKPDFYFKRNLQLGSRNLEVRKLQECLALFPDIYPERKITGYFGPKTKAAVIRFQEKYAEEILKPWGFKKGTGLVRKSTRAQLNKVCIKVPEEIFPLEFSLVTVNQPLLIKTAELLRNQWKKIGVNLKIKTFDENKLKEDFIKPRNYEALLFGQTLSIVPDPFSFWHSQQKRHPGLNLSGYENSKIDRLLKEIRRTLDPEIRQEKYASFQGILIEDAPAVFLYSPNYFYFIHPEIKGVETKIITHPSKRFHNIEEWYLRTGRVWK